MAAGLAREIDYDNFKAAVLERQGVDRHDLYVGVWAAMRSRGR